MSTSWGLNAGQFSTQAYRKLGILPASGVPTDDQMNQAIVGINAMLKGWQADGINLFRQKQMSLTIAAGQGVVGNPYVFPAPIMGLEEARWLVQGGSQPFERPLGIFTYVDYMNLPNKLSQGSPSVAMLDKQVGASNLYLWPVPQFGGTVNCTVARTVNDVTAPTDTLDFPVEWSEGAIYNLADRLMDDEGVAAADEVTAARITQHAVAFYEKLLNFDRPTSVMMRPWGKKGNGRFWR